MKATNSSMAVSAAVRVACLAWAAACGLCQNYPNYPWPQQSGPGSGIPGSAPQNPQQGQTQPMQPGMPQISPWDPRSVRPMTLGDLVGPQPTGVQGLFPTWTRPEAFQGFPVFPPSLGNYWAYPAGPGGAMAMPDGTGQLPPPAPPMAPDWPSWIKSRRPGSFPYEPTVAVVVRQSDRVWWRPDAEEPFVPLYHYDSARTLTAGSEVEVRHSGEFLLLLHGGTKLQSFGSTRLGIQALSEADAALLVEDFTWLKVQAASRGLRIALPDGSDVFVDPPGDPAGGGPGLGNAGIRIERRVEPGKYSGRATIFNFGDRVVRWVTPLGEVRLSPGYRVAMFLDNWDSALGGELRESGVAALADGAKRVWQPQEDGSVTWSGSRFELPRGSQLVLDPMLGDPFGKRTVVVPSNAQPPR